MKTVFLTDRKTCDYCKETAYYDAPTIDGPWGFLCEKHYALRGRVGGSKIVYEKASNENQEKEAMLGIEKLSIKYWEKVVMDGVREISCPSCKRKHRLEPDASGEFRCHKCKQLIIIPGGLL
mgnify:CR=1 FL=1